VYCDFATAGCANVTQTIVTLNPTRTNADKYLEIGFTSGAGSIPADDDQTIKVRLQKSTNYNDNNDYSFDATKTDYADWSKITIYRAGSLIWGTEPGGGSSTPTPTPTATPTPGPTPTPTPTPTPPPGSVNVSTAAQLQAALNAATPGQTIIMADGIYSDRFVTTADGNALNKITLQGSRDAVIDAGSTSGGYALHLNGANHWRLIGFTVRNAQKGIMLDESSNCLIDGVRVHNTGDEAVHFRKFSSNNTIQNSLITDTGKRRAEFGEGVYLGTAVSNWGSISGGNPDTSNYNQVLNNTIGPGVTGEMIDIKEGTLGGLINGNIFHGDDLEGDPPDSWIDVKGNGYTISYNIGHNPAGSNLTDGFQVHKINNLAISGNNNVFSNNTANVNGPGYGFWIHSSATGNVVYANNQVFGAASGFANIPVTP
jgi:hypothetical protein